MWLDDPLPLLQGTLAHAVAKIPHYREDPAYAAPLADLADLARLPFIRPEAFRGAPERFAVPELWPEMITYSSSTTGAIGRARWHLQRELDAHAAAVGALLGEAADADAATLVIHPYDQGAIQRPTGDRRTIYAPFLVPWHYEMILEFLTEGVKTPAGRLRIDHIDAFSPALRIYTCWLADRGIDPRSLGVTGLSGYGSIQPHAWRRRLCAAWGADYQDIFGLSEVKHSEAFACPACGAYHLLRPVVAEVVDADHGAPIDAGVGVLVLSELYPYAELQVLLRYWTGDLIEIARPCLLADLGFHFRGRLASAAVLRGPDGPVFVGSLQIGELLGEHADVALTVLAWAPWAIDAGAPRFTLRQEGPAVIIEVELRYSPALFPGRAAALCEQLRGEVLAAVTGLAALVDAGLAALTIRPCLAGSLREPSKI